MDLLNTCKYVASWPPAHLHTFLAHLPHTIQFLLRALPWLVTIFTANTLHYSSLWEARMAARLELAAKQKTSDEHQPLTFDLMKSPAMRLARYRIKAIRYAALLLHLFLFHCLLPEIRGPFVPGWGTVEGIVVGFLSGFVTIYMNENRNEKMRTVWRPTVDFQSQAFGHLWDALRLAGGGFAVPVEEELFYHSWLYRYLCQLLNQRKYRIFSEIPFKEWNWFAWITSNAFLALYNGQEWRSHGISGLLFQWVIARRGQFFDGVIAHSVCSLTIGFWVLISGERQYW